MHVEASDGDFADAVRITWSAVAGATRYRVYRDGAAIAEVVTTSYTDATATAPGPPSAPVNVSASEGTDALGVALSWSASAASPAAMHAYTVSTIDAAGESAVSMGDRGFRGAYPIERYEVSVGGGPFTSTGGSATSFVDVDAPGVVVTPGATDATDGTLRAHVAVSLPELSTLATPRSYRVRAANAAGPGDASPEVSGYRAAALQYHWFSSADPDGPWVPRIDETGPSFNDTFASPFGEPQYYYCLVSPAGGAPVASDLDSGYRGRVPTGFRADAWMTDGEVNALAFGDGAIYLGGNFNYLGPPTGGFALLDAAGQPSPAVAQVNGTVFAMASDGAGGWYIGGAFTSVAGVRRKNLAHLMASGALDPAFDPSPNDEVRALLLAGDVLYVGGVFTTIARQPRARLAGLVPASGIAVDRIPAVDGPVLALAAHAGVVYVGGSFASPSGNAAAFDTETGALTSWHPAANGTVQALAVTATAVYAAGAFSEIGGHLRSRAAKLDLVTGAANAWTPSPNGRVLALAIAGSTVFLGGEFTKIGVQALARLAAVDDATGAPVPFNAGAPDLLVTALATRGDKLYVAGQFHQIGTVARNRIAEIDLAGNVTSWNPGANSTVYAVAPAASAIAVAGEFSSAGGVPRNHLAAIDPVTGRATPWNPDADGPVWRLQVAGDLLYAAGPFTSVGGQPRTRLAAIDASSGDVAAWHSSVDGDVLALAVDGNVVYLGGAFANAGGQPRRRIAALDTTTGSATAWNPGADDDVESLTVLGGKVYAGGAFTIIGLEARRRIAALDALTGAVTPWNPDGNNVVTRLVPNGASIYVAGGFDTVGGHGPYLAEVDAATGTATAWAPAPSAMPFDIARGTAHVYVAVSSESSPFIGGKLSGGLTAVDAVTGVATDWNPHFPRLNSATLATRSGLVAVGGLFSVVEGQRRTGFALFQP